MSLDDLREELAEEQIEATVVWLEDELRARRIAKWLQAHGRHPAARALVEQTDPDAS